MSSADAAYRKLLKENADLRTRLEEAEDTLRAIRAAKWTPWWSMARKEEQVYTLKGADHAYRILVETISEGTVTLSPDGDILYANHQMAAMLGQPAGTDYRVTPSFLLSNPTSWGISAPCWPRPRRAPAGVRSS